MVKPLIETYDYTEINRKIQRKTDFFEYKDLRSESAESEYNSGKSPTENIQDFLREKIYQGNSEISYRHSFDIFHAIHEQTPSKGYENGFNDFANTLREKCAFIAIKDGKIIFLDKEKDVIDEFEAASSLRTDLRERTMGRREVIRKQTSASLREVLGEFLYTPLSAPNYHQNTFRVSPQMLAASWEPPVLLAEKFAKEGICAGYATEVLRYYLGNQFIKQAGIETLDAWEIKRRLLKTGAGEVNHSLNKFLAVKGGDIELSFVVKLEPSKRFPSGKFLRVKGDKAKDTPYYQYLYRKFLASARETAYPPSLITLFYHGTHHRKDVIEANQEAGAESLNSHITVNFGVDRRYLNTGVFRKPDEAKRASDVIFANFSGAQKRFSWMLKYAGVYLNGEKLKYEKGEFHRGDGSLALVSRSDYLEFEDTVVVDKFYEKNRMSFFTELMMTGKYELIEHLKLNGDKIPEERKNPAQTLFRVAEIIYLKPGETIEQVLQRRGVQKEELQYHFYAYERIGMDAKNVRPFDPVPIFELDRILAEVQEREGLANALAEVRREHAEAYMKNNPDENIFIIHPKQSPQELADNILQMRFFKPLEPLTNKEKQFILAVIDSANKSISFQIGEEGKVLGVDKYDAGEAVYVPESLLLAIKAGIEKQREKHVVYIPEKLPGGEDFTAAEFTSEEKRLIENSTNDSDVRIALALILAMEQKQVPRGILPVERKDVKTFAAALGYNVKSLGLFQIRPQPHDLKKYGLNGQELRTRLKDDPEFNAMIAAQRVAEIIPRARRIFELNKEQFVLKKPECMAFVLNSYHSSEGKVLTNIFSVWLDSMEETKYGKLSDKDERKPNVSIITARFKRLGEVLLKENLLTDITEADITEAVSQLERNKSDFLKSRFFAALKEWHERKTGEKLVIALGPEIIKRKNVITTFLNYGLRAVKYDTIGAIAMYSDKQKEIRLAELAAQT